jgi:hypothetical protein
LSVLDKHQNVDERTRTEKSGENFQDLKNFIPLWHVEVS